MRGVCWENGGKCFPVDEEVGGVVRDNWVEYHLGVRYYETSNRVLYLAWSFQLVWI